MEGCSRGPNPGHENWALEATFRHPKYADARSHFQNLLKEHTQEPALYTNIAVIDEITGNVQSAKELYNKIIDTDGTGMAAYNLARIVLNHDGNPSQAKQITQNTLKRYPLNANLWLIQAVADYKMGNKNSLPDTFASHCTNQWC